MTPAPLTSYPTRTATTFAYETNIIGPSGINAPQKAVSGYVMNIRGKWYGAKSKGPVSLVGWSAVFGEGIRCTSLEAVLGMPIPPREGTKIVTLEINRFPK